MACCLTAYKLILQISQCISQISHHAPFCNKYAHTCTFLLQNAALWDMGLVYCGVCATGYKVVKCTLLIILVKIPGKTTHKYYKRYLFTTYDMGYKRYRLQRVKT